MRILLLIAIACGCGGGSSKPAPDKPEPTAAGPTCATAYADYEMKWKAARSEELRDVDFDADAIEEIIEIEVAVLPKTVDVEKLRDQYSAVAAFIPDAPWPVALDAADAAIEQCGEEAPRPA